MNSKINLRPSSMFRIIARINMTRREKVLRVGYCRLGSILGLLV